PVVLATLVGAAGVISIAQPALIKDLQESRTKAFAEQVAAGKISQSDADRVLATLDWITQPAVLKAGGTLVSFGISVVRVFGWALALWVFGAVFLKTRFSFLKALEIAGLATMICVLESVVALVLTSGFGGAAPVESLAQLAAANQTPLRLIVGNLFSIWFVGLMAIGLARLAETQFSRTFMLVLGAWVASQLLLALVGAVLLALAG
ncbi:MAG TPA: hypothetical protein VK327_14925, partial [Candidatus Paceibacterota bacterium]|nr:hypothetical protein [Candidatus Paceibacterota bacterium]